MKATFEGASKRVVQVENEGQHVRLLIQNADTSTSVLLDPQTAVAFAAAVVQVAKR